MRPHPDFAAAAIPERVRLGSFGLRRLGPADLEEDMAAIRESADRLRGVFGSDWPDGLTVEDDLLDLSWHAREFSARRSFAWVVTDAADRYIGCAYVYPEIGGRGRADVHFWFRETAFADGDPTDAFREALRTWLAGPPWPPLDYTFRN